MIKIFRSVFAVGALVYGAAGSAATAQNMMTTMVYNNEIVISTGAGGFVILTHDQIPKYLPVWSKDGSMIAFIEKTGPDQALAGLVVIDRNGKKIAEILVQPAGGHEVEMRTVETVQWLTARRVAVIGSLDPSTSKFVIYDLISKRKVDESVFNGLYPSFSPDGLHAAYEDGSPHFTPEDERRPTLNIDYKRVFPTSGRRVEFELDPRWSPDSRTLAVIASDYGTKERKVVSWRADAGVKEVPFPTDLGTTKHLFWKDQVLYVDSALGGSASSAQTWGIAGGRGRPTPAHATDPRIAAAALQAQLREQIERAQGSDPNFWCQDCPLSALPRRASLND